MWRIQDGYRDGSYRTRYSFDRRDTAVIWYSCINTHSGYKKRILDPEGNVIARLLTHEYTRGFGVDD